MTNHSFLETTCIHQRHWTAMFFNERDIRYLREQKWMQAISAALKAKEVYRRDGWTFWMGPCWEWQHGYGRAFLASRKPEVVNRRYIILHLFEVYKRRMEFKARKMIFFIRQAPTSRRPWNSYRSSCRGHSRRTVRCILRQRTAYRFCWRAWETSALTRKTAKKERRDSHPRPAQSLDIWKWRTICVQRSNVPP